MHDTLYIVFDPGLYADFGLSNLCGQKWEANVKWWMSVAKMNDAKVRGKLRKGSGRNFRFDGKTTLEVLAEVMAKAERNGGEMFLSVWWMSWYLMAEVSVEVGAEVIGMW